MILSFNNNIKYDFYHSWSRKISYIPNTDFFNKWSDWSCKYCKKTVKYDPISIPNSTGCHLEL